MRSFAWIGARPRTLASAGIVTVSALAITTMAFLYEGFPTTDVELNDGSVWVTKQDSYLVGRFNDASGVLDAGLRTVSDTYDIVQHGRTVLVLDEENSSVAPVDVATVSTTADVDIPAGSSVGVGGDTVSVLEPTDGALWVTSPSALQGFAAAADDPVASFGKGAVSVTGADGTVYVASPEQGTVTTVRPGPEQADVSAQEVEGLDKGDDVAITVADTTPVVLNRTDARLWVAGLGLRDLDGVADAVLQHPSTYSGHVGYATPTSLVTVPLSDGPVAEVEAGGTGAPAAPVSLKGCVYGAWGGSARFARDCPHDTDDLVSDIPGMAADAAVVFRVNRDVVVLNDVVAGSAWTVTDALELVDNWDDIIPPEGGDETDQTSTEVAEETSLPERTEINHPPVAEDDDFGVRPGRTTVLPVLDNDNDPDGDVLTATAQGGVSIGEIAPIYGGRALQITVPEGATGRDVFTYEVNDGRPGGTDQATVSLEVRPWTVNQAPVQRKVPVVVVEQGGQVTYSTLLDWVDPDGDDMFLRSAVVDGGDEVDFASDGEITFRAVGSVQGRREVAITVSDGDKDTVGVVQVDVRPVGSTKPITTPDHVVLRVDEKVTVSPLDNDVSPSGAPLRLARVTEVAGTRLQPDYNAGTFSFASSTPGVYYVQYLATDGPQTVIGLVRMDVLPQADADEKPVAVRDVALLPSGQDVRIDVLANDSDPSGGILVVQSVTVPPDARVSVAVTDHRYLLVTDQSGLSQPVTIQYQISNGRHSAQGDVVVIPIPAPAQLRPPVAADDSIVVRAGDVATIPVMENDYHPNGDAIRVLPDLIDPLMDPADGEVFVSEDTLRFRAGPEAKTVYATYEVADSQDQKDAGYVTIQILPVDAENNQAPRPRDLTARALSGTAVKIPIPLDGIDPDGDSVQLVGVASAPGKGRVLEVGQNFLRYEPFGDATGTDEFTYTVQDRLGRSATASIRVGIAPSAAVNQAPFAVKDVVLMRPQRTVAVPVTVNDSDPEGDEIVLLESGLEVPEGIEASVTGDRVFITSGEEPGTKTLTYTIRDAQGASAVGALVVTVDPDVPLQAPIARDDRVTIADIGDGETVDVEVLLNDEDPDGVRDRLAITTDEEDVSVGSGGVVRVPVLPEARVVRYDVTDGDDLSAAAFIHVPGMADLRPSLRTTGAIEVMSGEQVQIPLADHVLVAGGGRAIVTEAAKVSAVHSNGEPLVKDADVLVYTSADGYHGADAITFEVTDGTGPDDPEGRVATLTLPITVLPPDNEPPTLSGAALTVSPGEEAATLDLRALASDPNEEDELTFRLAGSVPDGFSASVSDAVLSVSADTSTPKGTIAPIQVEVTDGESDPVAATMTATVTASSRPLAVASDDVLSEAPQGVTQTIDVLANDQSPFPDQPLTVIDAQVEVGQTKGQPRALPDGRVEVTPGAEFVGSLVVRYRVRDATGDADRDVDGRIRLTVQGRPEIPGTPTVSSVQDRTVVLSWTPPSNNGAEITSYTVTSTAGNYTKTCASTTCTLDGLTNNVEYNFTVTATNRVGTSDASAPSATARPDARPDTPQPPRLGFGDRALDISWTTPTTPGSPVESFDLEISPAPPSGATQKTGVTGNALRWEGLENGTSYQVRVRAVNRAPEPSSWSSWSPSEIPAGPPAAPAAPTTARLSPVGTQAQLQVNWSPPAANGDPISSYTLQVMRGGAVMTTLENIGGGVTSQAVNVEASTTDYTFSVAATNKAGRGAFSATSAPIRAFVNPGAPGAAQARPGDRQLVVTAQAAAGNGANPAELDYQYSLNGGEWRGDWAALDKSATITGTIAGLGNGTGYSVRLRAVNRMDAAYASAASPASNQVVPYGKPNTPGVSAQRDGTSVVFSWSKPALNGRDVTVQIKVNNGGWESVAANGSRRVGNGYDQTHGIRVQAVDTEGQVSAAGSAQASTAPRPAPQNGAQTAKGAVTGGCATTCYFLTVQTERDFPAGNYRYRCLANGSQFNDWEGPVYFAAGGTTPLQCWYGNPGRGHTVQVQLPGVPDASQPKPTTW
ncbi:Ig-like domain-containing protein [Microbacterium sp. zg.Y1090]|uniref:Ig-like domain-containing protein n=1 Tax=Microbacterium wangruii TaxID=3049073 RepID=UPI00214DA00E|nr:MULTISPECIES: Ig-like domain-containing protein [unclassified Microbacterium]MCR2819462.1 Ig-like domain-containing protein [Microbacterium sp. zg.Y1090]WIM28437.1 Ig-like domain-containing protein [Microbacterium sp. zg-Y1090]